MMTTTTTTTTMMTRDRCLTHLIQCCIALPESVELNGGRVEAPLPEVKQIVICYLLGQDGMI